MVGTMLEMNSIGEYKDAFAGDSGEWNVNILIIYFIVSSSNYTSNFKKGNYWKGYILFH